MTHGPTAGDGKGDAIPAAPESALEESKKGKVERLEYRSAFRSASIMGGASALQMAIRLVRAKAFAILLGPAGTGIIGLYTQVTNMTTLVSSFGITPSGVRQIAESVGSGDSARIARTDRTVRRVGWVTGTLGGLIQLSFCWLLSTWTFGDTVHWKAIAALSVIPLIGAVRGAQVARIQGFRRIGDLARQGVFGSLAGTAVGIAIVWKFGFKGIVPQIIVVAVLGLAFAFYFSKKVPVPNLKVSLADSVRESRRLLGLGFSFMGSRVAAALATYLIAALIARRLGVSANGLYVAAWSLSGLYANFVLRAMGADYYPKLTSVATDRAKLVSMVNQQAEIALLIAVPGIVGTLAFAPLAIRLFYTSAYAEAYEIMRWLILGVFLRLVSWPLAYILLAKGEAALYLVTEISHQVIYVTLVYVLIGPMGLPGVGVAFALLYVVYVVAMVLIAVFKYGFRYSANYYPIFAAGLAMTLVGFFTNDIQRQGLRYSVGVVVSVAACVLCGLILKRLMGLDSMLDVFAFLRNMVGLRSKRNGKY